MVVPRGRLLPSLVIAAVLAGGSAEVVSAAARPSIENLQVNVDRKRTATMRICAAKGLIRIVLREILATSGIPAVTIAEASDFRIRRQPERCRHHTLSWREFDQVGGIGRRRIEIRVIDQTGQISKPAQYSYIIRHRLQGRDPLLSTAATSEITRSCGRIDFSPNTEDGIFGIRSKGTTCRKARRVARAARVLGSQGPFEYRQSGFVCRGRYESIGLPRVRWICRKGIATVTFDRT